MNENRKVAQALATRLVERVATLGLKGKKADDEALAYWVGATVLAEETGNEALARYLGMLAAMLVSVRGMMWVREFVADGKKEAA